MGLCTITPQERPKELGAKAFFTDEEAAKYEKEENQRQNSDLIDPEQGGVFYPPGGRILAVNDSDFTVQAKKAPQLVHRS